MHIGKKILLGLLLICFAILMNACVVVVKDNPNSQTRTHTSASTQYWYYYPDSQVYYHITERYYYYPDHGRWIKVKRLPDRWVLNNDYRVRLRISGKPYMWHAKHKRQYPVRHAGRNDRADDYSNNREHHHGDERHHQTRDYPRHNTERAYEQPPQHGKVEYEPANARNREHGDTNKNIPPGWEKAAEARERAQQHRQQQADKHPQHKDHPGRDRDQSVAENPSNNAPGNSRIKHYGGPQDRKAQHPGNSGHQREYPDTGNTRVTQQGDSNASHRKGKSGDTEHGQQRQMPPSDMASMKDRASAANRESSSQKPNKRPMTAPVQERNAQGKHQPPVAASNNTERRPTTKSQHIDKSSKHDNKKTGASDKTAKGKGNKDKGKKEKRRQADETPGDVKKGQNKKDNELTQSETDTEIVEASRGNGKGKRQNK